MEWPQVNLSKLCHPKQWPTISSKQLTEDGYPVYGANGKIGLYSEYNHKDPTICITCRGATCGTLNITPENCYITGNAMALDDVATDIVDFRFLYYALLSRGLKDAITGAAQPQITRGNLAGVEIPLPPPSEQRRIVEILDQADALRKKRAEADKIADRILPVLFYKMFGDPATNPEGWDVEPLGKLGELDRGRSRHRPRNDPRLLGGPYPFIQTGDVAGAHGYIRTHTATYSEFGLSQSRMWPAGTLCITIAANIAASAILGFDACFPDSVVGFASGPRTNAAFIRVLLGFLRPILESFAPQMAQKNINLKILRDIMVPVPPKQLQDKFAEEHDSVVSMAENGRKTADRLETLFTVLLHRAFSGALTANWREAHMKELLQEMEQQVKALGLKEVEE